MQSIGAQYYHILTRVTCLTVYFAIAMAAEIGRNQYPLYSVYKRLARGEHMNINTPFTVKITHHISVYTCNISCVIWQPYCRELHIE